MGRIRASRGATLNPEQVAAFDTEHEVLLAKIAEPEFTITYRIDAHILRPGMVAPVSLRRLPSQTRGHATAGSVAHSASSVASRE